MRVLVVEDEARLADGLRRGLEGKGFAVDIAPEGGEGLWCVRENSFDVVLEAAGTRSDRPVRRLGRRAADVRRRSKTGLRVWVTLAASVVAILGAAIGSTVSIVSLRESLRQTLWASAEQQANPIVEQVNDWTTPSKTVVGGVEDVTTQIVDPSGTLIASDRRKADQGPPHESWHL